MFTPHDRELERGWRGREHDDFALADVQLRPPVLHPGSVRIFDGDDFVFGNPSCIYGHDETVALPRGADRIEAQLRVAGVIGGFTLMNDWLATELGGAKAHDFGTTLGPVVVTPDEFAGEGTDWHAL